MLEDINLLKKIYFIINNNNIKNYKEITDLNLFNKSLSGKILNIDLKEIIELEGLEKLTLNHFTITDETLDILNKLEKLYKIEFYFCEFKTNKTLEHKMQEVMFYSCKTAPINILNNITNIEKLTIINSGFINISDLQTFINLKYLKINKCEILSLPMIEKLINLEKLYLNNIQLEYEFNITMMTNLGFISFNGSKHYDKQSYINNLKKQNVDLLIEWEEDDFPKEYL